MIGLLIFWFCWFGFAVGFGVVIGIGISEADRREQPEDDTEPERRSKLRADLADAGVVIGLAVAALICVAIWPDEIARVAYVLVGGAK